MKYNVNGKVFFLSHETQHCAKPGDQRDSLNLKSIIE